MLEKLCYFYNLSIDLSLKKTIIIRKRANFTIYTLNCFNKKYIYTYTSYVKKVIEKKIYNRSVHTLWHTHSSIAKLIY